MCGPGFIVKIESKIYCTTYFYIEVIFSPFFMILQWFKNINFARKVGVPNQIRVILDRNNLPYLLI